MAVSFISSMHVAHWGIMSPAGSSLTYVLGFLRKYFTHNTSSYTHQMCISRPGRLRARETRSLTSIFIEICLVLEPVIKRVFFLKPKHRSIFGNHVPLRCDVFSWYLGASATSRSLNSIVSLSIVFLMQDQLIEILGRTSWSLRGFSIPITV